MYTSLILWKIIRFLRIVWYIEVIHYITGFTIMLLLIQSTAFLKPAIKEKSLLWTDKKWGLIYTNQLGSFPAMRATLYHSQFAQVYICIERYFLLIRERVKKSWWNCGKNESNTIGQITIGMMTTNLQITHSLSCCIFLLLLLHGSVSSLSEYFW